MVTKLSRGQFFGGISLAILFAFAGGSHAGTVKAAEDHRPNIVLLVADDMGYADLPRFGGEVETPNIDNLAAAGITFDNFHPLPACSPTRSVLLSAVDNHLNGMGSMPDWLARPGAVNQRGHLGYLGYLNDRVATGPELLRKSGYHTYMAGKWHLAAKEKDDGGFLRGTWPIDRGFERSTGVLEGGSEQFGRREFEGVVHYFEDDHYLTGRFPPPDFYTTKNYTQKIIEYIDSNRADGKPFFVYWAPNTPHWPHQAPKEEIEKYVNRKIYDRGWDAIREQRFNRMKQLGVISNKMELPPRAPGVPAWDDPNDPAWQPLLNAVLPYQDVWGIQDIAGLKRTLAKDMAVYTAMINCIDLAIGRLIAYLKLIGEYDNTIFVFLSDNGPDAKNLAFFAPGIQDWFRQVRMNNSLANLGWHNSMSSYAAGWAQVSGTPFFSAKLAVGDSGIRTPLIIAYPGDAAITGGRRSKELVTVQDILPTLLSYAGVSHPAATHIPPNQNLCVVPYENRTICPMNGKSMVNFLEGTAEHLYSRNTPLGFELFGSVNKALYQGDWKILRLGDVPWGAGPKQPWKLFHLSGDPTELHDLASDYPEQLQEMVVRYDRYEKRVGFIPVVNVSGAAQRSVSHVFGIEDVRDLLDD